MVVFVAKGGLTPLVEGSFGSRFVPCGRARAETMVARVNERMSELILSNKVLATCWRRRKTLVGSLMK